MGPPRLAVGRKTASKIIEAETGKRLYASDLPYQEQMQKLSQKYVQAIKLVKQSEFKKPYLEDSYEEMEHFEYPGPEDPDFPSGPGGFNDDCKVGWENAGAVEGWRICSPSDDCAGWVFTCAHKIIKIDCSNCIIKMLKQLDGDRLLVVICSKENDLKVTYKHQDGSTKTVQLTRSCLGTGPDPACTNCTDCVIHPPAIGYTTQQMSTSGTQNLNADGGGGGPYTWSIIAGGGTLSKTVTTNNEMTVYTAPATNAGCSNNPTIQVKDYCGNTATLKIAVNAWGGADIGYNDIHLFGSSWTCPSSACHYIYNQAYRCNGAWVSNLACGSCTCNCRPAGYTCYTYTGVGACGTDGGSDCGSLTNLIAGCTAPANCFGDCTPRIVDSRTADMLTGGCCPAALIT